MKVVRATTAGFCMGVGLALRKLDALIQSRSGKPLYTLGPIIHNPQVLQDYAAKGVKQAQVPEDIPSGSQVVIRAHGIPQPVEMELRERDVDIVDATCPKVKKAQLLIAEQTALGRRLILYGEAEHPEVKGLLSYARDDSLVFETLEQLQDRVIDSSPPCFIAAQTTQDRVRFDAAVATLRARLGNNLPVLNTICDATKERQQEAVNIAHTVSAMVVVGGFESGNTRRLAHVVAAEGIFCVHVETPDQLPLDSLREYSILGLTGGASTPKQIIDAIEEKLKAL